MQDRFKFRFWNTKIKCMYEDSGLTSLGVNGSIKSALKNNYVIMQCTGLKDKNDKLIYEGDIVKDRNNFILRITCRQAKGAFYLENDRIAGAISELKCSTDTMEIIGNIYENPELETASNHILDIIQEKRKELDAK